MSTAPDVPNNGRNVVIFGGCGNVGRGAVYCHLKNGANLVFVVSRFAGKLKGLRDYFDNDKRVIEIVADVSCPRGAASAYEQVSTHQIHHVVDCIGGWVKGTLEEMSAQEYLDAQQSHLNAHFFVWKHFASVSSLESYVIVNGATKDHLPRSGITGLLAKQLSSLIELLRASTDLERVFLVELVVGGRVADDDGDTTVSYPPRVFGQIFVEIANKRVRDENGVVSARIKS